MVEQGDREVAAPMNGGHLPGGDWNGRLSGLDQGICQPQGEVPVRADDQVLMGIRREPVNAELMQGRPPLGNDENGRLAGLDQEVCQPQGEVPVHDEEPVPIGTMGQEANGPGHLHQSRLEDQGQFPSELEEDERIMLMA